MHPGSIAANDGKEAEAVFFIVDRARLKRFDEGQDRSQRSAQLVRNVGKEFLPHMFQSLDARYINEHAQRSFRALAVRVAEWNHAKIKDHPFRPMGFNLHSASLHSF